MRKPLLLHVNIQGCDLDHLWSFAGSVQAELTNALDPKDKSRQTINTDKIHDEL